MSYLTKTRFVLAVECARKLQYVLDPNYPDAQEGDDFLESLASGGHQVGALARLMYPGGHLVGARSTEEQVRVTAELLAQDTVTLFEGSIRHEQLLVRCDILEKTGNEVKLIEVKSKSYDPATTSFRTQDGAIASDWEFYLYDVTYQAHVLGKAFPQFRVTPYLMLVDKSVTVALDGLNTRLPVITAGRRATVTPVPGFTADQLTMPVLRSIDVSDEVRLLRNAPIALASSEYSFDALVKYLANALQSGVSLPANIGGRCKKCQFYVEPDAVDGGHKSGWQRCMSEHFGRLVTARRRETVFGLHAIREGALSGLLAKEPPELMRVSAGALGNDDSPEEKIKDCHRWELQWKEHHGSPGPLILKDVLRAEMGSWRWPLHFIDFETSRPALPYHAGRTPYDQILFQFSHHVLQSDGRLEHRTQFLEATPGVAPSLPALRALRDALSGDDGTVIHWWDHERTVLGEIRRQVVKDSLPDADILLRFLEDLIGSEDRDKKRAEEAGRLADLGRLVSRTAFFPGTNGSSSIKRVLPAALKFSPLLRKIYGVPVYGSATMPSLNFDPRPWAVGDGADVRDPYTLLDPLFEEADLERAVVECDREESDAAAPTYIANGGAAMIAYDRLQQRGLPEAERQRLKQQLLRYCELDTLAMVMVYQALNAAI